MREKIAIIGLGVIGSSLGMTLSASGKYYVVGVDKDPLTLQIAIDTKAISEGTVDCIEGVRGAHIVFLSVPVAEIVKIGKRIKEFIEPDAVVTDVGSTKEFVVSVLDDLFPSRFVGGHPMTGSELAGIKGADQYLFENALYVLTPTPRTDLAALQKIEAVINETGARVIYLSPQDHDVIVAAVSHLPHLLATVLMNYASRLSMKYPETLALAAGGFRDLTRIAAGHPSMWCDIYASNRSNIIESSCKFRKMLLEIEEALKEKDFDFLCKEMENARQERDRIPIRARGFLPAVYEVLVTIPDQPGSLANVTGILGKKGINIIDIEILRVREGEGGTIRLAFRTKDDAEKAFYAIREKGIIVKRR